MIPLASSFFRINVLIVYYNDSDKFPKSVGTKIKKRFLEVVRLLKIVLESEVGEDWLLIKLFCFFHQELFLLKLAKNICKCFNELWPGYQQA